MRRSLTRREVLKLGGGALAERTFALAGCAHGGWVPVRKRGELPAADPQLDHRVRSWRRQRHHVPHPDRDLQYDLYSENIVATNLEGGDGARGWGFVYNQKSPYHISSTSGSFMTTRSRRIRPGADELHPHRHARHRRHALRREVGLADTMEEFVAAAKRKISSGRWHRHHQHRLHHGGTRVAANWVRVEVRAFNDEER